jgi:lipopolysaccharide/colanic/teichoic acid biosynthesis glycosyltransferase
VLLFVLMPFILFGNGINNKGKLFYTQVGKDGVVFSILNSDMKNDSESDGAVFSTNGDNRVTAFGKFMRKPASTNFLNFLMY